MPSAGLVTFPKAGHLINLEDPAAFNEAIDDFHAALSAECWHLRDANTTGASAYISEEKS
jgi:3-oxoadipate enol-lactonase